MAQVSGGAGLKPGTPRAPGAMRWPEEAGLREVEVESDLEKSSQLKAVKGAVIASFVKSLIGVNFPNEPVVE